MMDVQAFNKAWFCSSTIGKSLLCLQSVARSKSEADGGKIHPTSRKANQAFSFIVQAVWYHEVRVAREIFSLDAIHYASWL